jgi:hypothetical protein
MMAAKIGDPAAPVKSPRPGSREYAIRMVHWVGSAGYTAKVSPFSLGLSDSSAAFICDSYVYEGRWL